MSGYLLGFTAGGFLYLALANMVPELLKSATSNQKVVDTVLESACAFLGAGLIIYSH